MTVQKGRSRSRTRTGVSLPRRGRSLGLMLSGLSAVLSVGYVTGHHYANLYLRSQLIPSIAADLSQSLRRPVHLGEVEHLSLTQLTLGESTLPATATDADHVTIAAVEIRVDVWRSLQARQVELDVTLVEPRLWLDQTSAGQWFNTDLILTEDDAIALRRLRIQNGAIVWVPNPDWLQGTGVLHERSVVNLPPQVELTEITLDLQLNADMTQAQARGELHAPLGGSLTWNGTADLTQGTGALTLQARSLSTLPFNLVLPPSIRFTAGHITTQITAQLQPHQPPAIAGTVTLTDVAAWVAGEPNPFTQTSGELAIADHTIRLTQGTTRYGQIPFTLQGDIDLVAGLNLSAQVASVSVPDFMQTFNFSLPVPARGALKTENLRVTGPLAAAVFSGTVMAAEPIQLDRVAFAAARTDFSFNTGTDQLRLQDTTFLPDTGGRLVANAMIQLDEGDNDAVALNLTAQDVNGRAIAALYDLDLPAHTLDSIQATMQASVAQQTPTVQVDWRTQVAGYAAQGQLALANDIITLPQAIVQIGEGEVHLTGALQEQQWRATIAADAVPLNQLATLNRPTQPQVDLPGDLPGILQGTLTLAGALNQPDWQQVTGNGSAVVQVADSQIQAEIAIAQGAWHSQIHSPNLELHHLSPQLTGQIQGDITLAGTLDQLDPRSLQLAGTVALPHGLNQIQQPLTSTFSWQGDRLYLHEVTAPGLTAQGWLAVAGDSLTALDITAMDVAVQVQDYDLATVPSPWSDYLQIQGQTSLAGRLTGTRDRPQLQADLHLQDVALQLPQVAPITFDLHLYGQLDLSAQGSRLTLAGQRDAIAMTLGEAFQPQSLQVDWAGASLHAQLDPTQTQLTAIGRNVPLDHFPLPTALQTATPIQGWDGQLSAEVQANWANHTPTIAAQIQVDQPGVVVHGQSHQRSTRDRLTAAVHYAEGAVTLSHSELHMGNSQLQLQGQIPLAQPDRATGTLTISQGDLQDLRWLAARILPPTEPSLPLTTAWVPPAIAPVSALADPDQPQPDPALASSLPVLAALPQRGQFSGVATLQSDQGSPRVQVDAQGADWWWDQVGLSEIHVTAGQWQPHRWQLPQVELSGLMQESPSGDRQVFDTRLTLSLDPQAWSGQLQLDHMPLAPLGELGTLPVAVDGRLSAIATLSGTAERPALTAHIAVQDPAVQALSLADFEVALHYQDDFLSIGDRPIALPIPAQTPGRIPYPFPGLSRLAPASLPAAPPPISETSPAPTQDTQMIANQVVFAFGPLQRSVAIADLVQFGDTGQIPASWELYFRLAQVDREVVRHALTQPLPLDGATLDHLLNSPIGEDTLEFVGQVLHTPSRQANVEALRSALVLAAIADQPVSILDVIQHYPAAALHIDGARLLQLLQQIDA